MGVTPPSNGSSGCDYKNGMLPECAPLVAAYVPMQQANPPKYANNEALTRGTLFPGLDLPLYNEPNKTNPCAGTPLGELMAIDFMIRELNLYLDTHKNDTEAFMMLKELIALSKEGREKYVKMYGPIMISDLKSQDRYSWLNDPWPWERAERGSK